jgi:hypothetical protein
VFEQGFAELAQFFRVLDKGMHFLRLNRLGDPCNTQVGAGVRGCVCFSYDGACVLVRFDL